MSILSKILPQKAKGEYFLVLGIEEHRISAAIAHIIDNQISIIGTGESEWSSAENESEAADIAISAAEKNLPEDILVDKVVLGLPLTFLDDDKVKPEEMEKMKRICKELDLKPLGYIDYPQALMLHLEIKEESKPTTFLLSVGKSNLIFSLIRVGKIEKSCITARTDSFINDFTLSLKSFKDEILPSRILLYDEADNLLMENIKEELLSLPWNKHSSFLHTPRIEILPSQTVLKALVEAVGSTMLTNLEIVPQTIAENITGEISPKPVLEILKDADNFGFVEETNFPDESKPPGIAGPVLPKPITDTLQNTVNPTEGSGTEKLPDPHKVTKEGFKFPQLPPDFTLPLPKNLLAYFPYLLIPLFIIISLSMLVYYYPKAVIKLIVYPEVTRREQNVVFTTGSDLKTTGKNIIGVNEISTNLSEDNSAPTTGKNKVGDSSRGEVTVYNKTQNSKIFSKGTTLVSGDLKFTLDQDTAVASASDTGEGLIFSKTAAKVTAVQIGPESNLTSGSNFIFKDFPQTSYYAKNNQPLTGGTSREVASVSKDDQDMLLLKTTDGLFQRAKQDLMSKINPGEKLIEQSMDKSIISKNFSKDIGSEAQTISLSLNLNISAFVYRESDLLSLPDLNQSNIKPGFKEDIPRRNIRLDSIKTDKNGNITASVIISSYFIPDINTDIYKADITGKTFSSAGKRFQTADNVAGVEIISLYSLPFMQNLLPINGKNIHLEIVPR